MNAASFVVVVVAVVLTGCASPPTKLVWNKSGATEPEFRKDQYECEKDVRQSGLYGGGASVWEQIARQENIRQFFHRCMNSKGYTASYVPA